MLTSPGLVLRARTGACHCAVWSLLLFQGCARGPVSDTDVLEAGATASDDNTSLQHDRPDGGNADAGISQSGAASGGSADASNAPRDAGVGAGAGAMADAGGAPEDPACSVGTARCGDARDLGMLAGDKASSNNWFELKGTGSDWVKVLIKEDSSTGHSLRVSARLQASGDGNYDLYLYRSESPDMQSCVNQVGSSTQAAGVSEEATSVWDNEGLLGNGNDDSRIVTVEVRHVGGSCSAWTLRVEGLL